VFLPGLTNLPVIDRDEARFAQASVQMAESGEFLDIRFQDQTRYKKPSGIYWLQTAAIKIFSENGERKIWAQRIPSTLGALLAVFAVYWGAARMIGRRGAVIAAGMLALSALVIFEAHIAKTDAMLLGLSACCLGSLAHMRHGGGKKSAWVFWLALGASVMIKGPVLPILVLLTLLMLAIWERKNSWMKRLLNWPAIIVFVLIWVPWAIIMWNATDGAFFVDSLGKDFGGKLVSAQESHPGPPGYYLATIWITLWPTCLLLLPGFGFAFRAVRNGKGSDAPVIKAMRRRDAFKCQRIFCSAQIKCRDISYYQYNINSRYYGGAKFLRPQRNERVPLCLPHWRRCGALRHYCELCPLALKDDIRVDNRRISRSDNVGSNLSIYPAQSDKVTRGGSDSRYLQRAEYNITTTWRACGCVPAFHRTQSRLPFGRVN